MKKFNCPVCGKELIRLEPFHKGIFNFWCDNCDIDIAITKNDEVEKEKLIVYRVGFNGDDVTEVDATCEDEAIELAKMVARESGVGFELDYIESYGYAEDCD